MADVTDMRGYIETLESMGELRRIEGADLNTEVGALTELAADKQGPALLFSNFDQYPAGFRIISNVFRTCKRTGPAMGIDAENGIDYLYAWRKKLADTQVVLRGWAVASDVAAAQRHNDRHRRYRHTGRILALRSHQERRHRNY